MLFDIKMKKNMTELGHSDLLKIYVNLSKIYVNPAFKSIQSAFKWLVLLNHCVHES